MNRPSYATVGRYAACGAVGAMVAMLSVAAIGFRLNTTPSIPLGIYRAIGGAAQKGDIVAFCPPNTPTFIEALHRGYIEHGDCPSGSYEMLKRILAAKGDRVEVSPDGVRINGRFVAQSAPQLADGMGRPLPQLNTDWTLEDGEYVVMGDGPDSFDSRYYGPIHARQISAAIKPVVTW